ncbi:hypothetical protein RKK42_22445 [Klebsiella pneumoniae]|nr:hypothetical protein [Klebsiella pneumoniae]
MKAPPAAARSRKRAWWASRFPNLRIPGFEQPWEEDFGKPDRIVTAWTS